MVDEGQKITKRLAAMIGTRPEAIKMAPVLGALRRSDVQCALVCTGQHRELDLPGAGMRQYADARLGLEPAGLDADAMCDRIEALAGAWIARFRPSLLLVQGDTNSALGGPRAARRSGVPVAHVEAGLRTFDACDPWPEERNRVEIDSLSALLFAPTETACGNLRRQRVPGRIILSGNSGIDALLDATPERNRVECPERLPRILVTVHRRENRGAGIVAVGEALRRIAAASEVEFVVALHPNGQTRDEMICATEGLARRTMLGPQSHRAMVALMLNSSLVLTDSGGLQEEAPALGRPVLILRETTERPEVVASGNAILVGTDPARIAAQALRLLGDPAAHARMSVPAFPYGTGGASTVIARTIRSVLA